MLEKEVAGRVFIQRVAFGWLFLDSLCGILCLLMCQMSSAPCFRFSTPAHVSFVTIVSVVTTRYNLHCNLLGILVLRWSYYFLPTYAHCTPIFVAEHCCFTVEVTELYMEKKKRQKGRVKIRIAFGEATRIHWTISNRAQMLRTDKIHGFPGDWICWCSENITHLTAENVSPLFLLWTHES